jgi:hypothetical protein
VLPNFAAEGEGVSAERLVEDVMGSTPEPRSGLGI